MGTVMSTPETVNTSPMTSGRAAPFLSVLGPMSARLDGRDLPLGPPRRRTLLALLLIRLGRVVPTELLVEELWGDGAPRHAVATLQSHVSHLRRVLDTAETGQLSVLRHRSPGYVLELDPDYVDACRFERLVTDGRRLLEQHDARTARARFTEASGCGATHRTRSSTAIRRSATSARGWNRSGSPRWSPARRRSWSSVRPRRSPPIWTGRRAAIPRGSG